MLRPRVDRPSALAPALVILSALALAGCDTQAGRDFNQSTRGLGAFVFGTPGEDDPVPIDPNAPALRPAIACPPMAVRDGTETHRVYARGHDGDPAYLIYQGSISRTARECTFEGTGAVAIKYGVAGRVILGPAGQPGTFQMPVRTAFVRPGGQAVWSKGSTVSVTVPQGENSADYSYVEQAGAYQIPAEDIINHYVIYTGFDDRSGR
ncbi:hypothetical protein [Lutibaculum baratangense]|uniref:Lipoprotein n=1 Tax=Lutibaculum baratangense AMV1 TaxID=631454 RepID=V4RJF5_9HYPH|nr:hypothetical protein [Lutibaculum baratangense]ESR26231.1 hypothetical protein N177_1090 [Lutibaculum baratangense AMV1]